MEVSHALMEVMCEQLQTLLYTFHQQQTAERGTAERTDLDSNSKSTNLIGVVYLTILNFTEICFTKNTKILILRTYVAIVKNFFFVTVFEYSFPCAFVVLGVESSSKVVESQLADFLVFLRRILSLRVMKRLSTFVKWIDPLMAIISHKCSSGKTIYSNHYTQC